MSKLSKKVVLIIVEGICDEHLFAGRLNQLYKGYNIRFEIQGGDILNNSNSERLNSIKNKIGKITSEFIKKKKFRDSDILAVLHVIDIDGCFIPVNKIIVDLKQEKHTFYHLDKITVSSIEQQERIAKRNEIKARNIRTLNTISKIKCFDYRLYYFSSNLEHVLFDNQNPDNEGKFDNVDKFLNDLEEPIEVYLRKYMQGINDSDDNDLQYKKSWQYLTNHPLASLQRSTNTPLLFSFLIKSS